ncbi:MAG: hypothetical protein DI539_27860 [Flavobacterium psychrophilum]|nr:MAG: hypothetical protein DI539_27860 [Flavobacterium psychrophilum]
MYNGLISDLALQNIGDRKKLVKKYITHISNIDKSTGAIIWSICYANASDVPRSFAERMAGLELDNPCPLVILTAASLRSSLERPKTVKRILHDMARGLKEFTRVDKPRPENNWQSFKDLLVCLHQHQIPNVLIVFEFDIEELRDNQVCKELQEMLILFNKELREGLKQYPVIVHSMIQIQGKSNFQENKEVYSLFADLFERTLDLEKPGLINKTDVMRWIHNELKVQDPAEINYYLKKYFHQQGLMSTVLDLLKVEDDIPDFEMNMREVATRLRQLVADKNKTPRS